MPIAPLHEAFVAPDSVFWYYKTANCTVSKTSAQYKNGAAAYIIDNTDNAAFTLHRERRDLLYFLHGY